MKSKQSWRVSVPGKWPQHGNSWSKHGEEAGEAYSRQAVLAVWTGPLFTPSPFQQYNGPVARGSSLHCVSSPGPPKLKWSHAASSQCIRKRDVGERVEKALIRSSQSTLFSLIALSPCPSKKQTSMQLLNSKKWHCCFLIQYKLSPHTPLPMCFPPPTPWLIPPLPFSPINSLRSFFSLLFLHYTFNTPPPSSCLFLRPFH